MADLGLRLSGLQVYRIQGACDLLPARDLGEGANGAAYIRGRYLRPATYSFDFA